MNQLIKKNPEIKDFPKKLQKLAVEMINSADFCTIKEACRRVDLNYESVTTMISRCNKKGNDFHGLVSDNIINVLKRKRPEVYRSLVDRALDGSHTHQKLYSQLVGDIQTGSNHNVNVNIQNNVRFPVSKSDVIPVDLQNTENE